MTRPLLSRGTARRMRRNQGSLKDGCIGSLGCACFLVIELCVLWMAVLGLLVMLFGQNVTATVCGHHTEDNEGIIYCLDYRYSMNGATYFDQGSVSSSQYSHLSDGDRLEVRVLRQFPAGGSQVQLPGRNPWLPISLYLVFSMPLLGGVWVLLSAAIPYMVERARSANK